MSQSGVQNDQNSGSDSDSEEENQILSQQGKDVVASSTIVQSTNIKSVEEEDSDENDSDDDDQMKSYSQQSNEVSAETAKLSQGFGSAETESSSDSSDSDEEEEENVMEVDLEEVERKLAFLNGKLQYSPNSYDLLVEKISLLRQSAELAELRETREKLSSLYPLSETLWMDWIKDELKLAHTEDEKSVVSGLFERAVKDYLSIELWLEYTKFVLSAMGADDGVQRCRDIFERALGAGGLHVALGSLIWDAYRDFEAALIGLCTDEDSRIEQEKRYTSVSRRQLSVPLFGMDETYEDIKSKLTVEDMMCVQERYDAAVKKFQSIEPYEQQIVLAVDGDITAKVQIYKDYVSFEKNEKSNPARIQCLYERAVAECPLDSSLWIDYIHYVLTSLSIADIVIDVCNRATRNCPWVLETWMEYFLVAERFDSEKLVGIFELAVLNCYTIEQAGTLWLKYLECLRRILTKKDYPEKDVQIFYSSCTRAEEHLLTMSNVEPNEYVFQIAMMNIRLRGLRGGMKQARELWADVLVRNYGHSFRNWIQYLMLEQRHGDAATYRHHLSKATAYVKDDIHSIASLWLNFERDNGDAHQLQVCEKKIAKCLEEQASQAQYDTLQKDNFSKNRRPRDFSHGGRGKFQVDDRKPRGPPPRRGRFPANGDNGPPRKFQEGEGGKRQYGKFQNDNDRHGSQPAAKKQHQPERKRKFQDDNKDNDGSQPEQKKVSHHDDVDGHQQNPAKGEATTSDVVDTKDDGVFKVPLSRKPKFERPNRTPTRMLQRRPPTSFVPRSLQINKSNATTEAPTVTTTIETASTAPKTPMTNKDFRAKFLGTSSSSKND